MDMLGKSDQVVAELIEMVEEHLDRTEPENRARVALLTASKLVQVAAYYAVQTDPAAPRLQLFDLAGHLDAASDRISGRRMT